MRSARSASQTVVIVVATTDTELLIIESLRRYDVDVRLAANYGRMAEALFDDREHVAQDRPTLFIVDLRLSCGAAVLDARLRDYDAALNAYVLSGRPWPRTLCLVEVEQTHPVWLSERHHLRATLLADEVDTVVGQPHRRDWQEAFATAVSRCLTE